MKYVGKDLIKIIYILSFVSAYSREEEKRRNWRKAKMKMILW